MCVDSGCDVTVDAIGNCEVVEAAVKCLKRMGRCESTLKVVVMMLIKMILMLVQARADWTAAPCSCSGQGISAHALRHWQVKLEPHVVTPKQHLTLMHTRNVIGRELTVRGGKEAVPQWWCRL